MPALKIAHVVRQFAPAVGGMEEFVEKLALEQLAAGHMVRVITLDRIFDDADEATLSEYSNHRGIEVVRVKFVGSTRYPISPAAISHVAEMDLIHVHGLDFSCDYFALTKFIHGKPMVLSTHGGFFHTKFAWALKQAYFNSITRFSLRSYGAVIACSGQDFTTFARICKPRLRLLRNPVATDKFERSAKRTHKVAIYFGRFSDNKRLDRLIGWFEALKQVFPGWELLLAGRPSDISSNELISLIDARGLSDSIEVHETPDQAELGNLIARSNAYCSASEYEGFGLAAVEAAAAGLYPVLSDIPPYEAIRKEIGFGTIIDFSNAAQLRSAAERFIADLAAFRATATEEAIAEAVEPFDWSHSACEFEKIYRQVLGQSTRMIGKISVDVLDHEASIKKISDSIRRQEPLMVTFCNAHSVNLAAQNPGFREAVAKGIVLNDGVGVDIGSKLIFGTPFPANLNGTDFVPQLLSRNVGLARVYLLGSQPGVAEIARDKLRANFPGLEIVGAEHGFFQDMDSNAIIERAKRANANVILVGMGQPRQEQWAALHFADFDGPVICVGALLDFVAEIVPRAPSALRKLRLEWLYRLWVEPRRLASRYLIGNLTFLARIFWQKIQGVRI